MSLIICALLKFFLLTTCSNSYQFADEDAGFLDEVAPDEDLELRGDLDLGVEVTEESLEPNVTLPESDHSSPCISSKCPGLEDDDMSEKLSL